MRRFKDQRGSVLILLIGVIAAVAILATSLVVMTSNNTHNMGQVRSATKSFDVAESALDRGMYKLGGSWPTTATLAVSWTTTDQTKMRDTASGGFSLTDYPAPRIDGVQFTNVMFVDNQQPIDYSVHWDKGGPEIATTPILESVTPDNRMYVIATGATGTEQTRVMALVERTFLDVNLPRGVALAANGDLMSNGSGNNPKIKVEVPPPAGIVTAVHVSGSIEEPDVTAPSVYQSDGSNGELPGAADRTFSPSLVAGLKATAEANGRYFTSLAAAEASPVAAEWSPQGGLSGLTVIEYPVPTTVKMDGNDVINSEAVPGILMVLGGGELQWGGTQQFYGIIYTQGTMDTTHGTGDIHGMAVTTGTESMKGTPNIWYNDKCIANMLNRFSLNVKMVTNTWRELPPDVDLGN
jgi:hypothetical protein